MKRALLAAAASSLCFASTFAFAQESRDGALLAAIVAGEHADIAAALKAGADANARRADGASALALAIDRQMHEAVRLLLTARANPNVRDEYGTTPLSVACARGDAQLVKDVAAAGARVGDPGPDSIPPLALCAGYSTPEALATLIAAGADVNAASALGQTPLMWAASRGNVANIRFLLEKGAKANAVSANGFTPLLFAAKNGSREAVTAIMAAGGDVKYVTPKGATVLQVALAKGDFEIAEDLVARGANIKIPDLVGRYPLHVAAAKGQVSLVRLLLAKGADPNILTKQAYRALDPLNEGVAPAQQGGLVQEQSSLWPESDPSVKIVIRRVDNSNPIPPPPAAETPLFLAAESGSLETMKVLVAAGARGNYKAKDGKTLVFAAARSGNPDVVSYALSLAPEIDATVNNQSVMHVAVQAANNPRGAELLRLLADKGAKLDVKDRRGQTPLDVARRTGGQTAAVYTALLKERGVASPGDPPRPAAPAAAPNEEPN